MRSGLTAPLRPERKVLKHEEVKRTPPGDALSSCVFVATHEVRALAPFSKKTRMQAFFKGKTAVVTGGASGIGRATAVLLKRLGATVMVGDRQKPAAADGLLYAPCDVAEVADLEGLLTGAVSQMGHVDLWYGRRCCRTCAWCLGGWASDCRVALFADACCGAIRDILCCIFPKYNPHRVNNAGLEIETSWKPFGKKAMDPANRAKLASVWDWG